MPKINKSKILFLSFIVLIIVLLVIVLSMNDKSNLQTTNTPNQQLQKSSITHDEKNNATIQKNLKQIEIPPILPKKPETKLDKPLFFSDDPFINRSIILGLYHDCINLFYLDKNKGIDERYKHKTQKINNRITERFKYCQKINDQHPDFYLDNSEQLHKKQTGSNTLLEKVLNHKVALGEDDYNDSQFIKELSLTDPRILLSSNTNFAMTSFHLYNSQAIVMNLIHSQQLGYVGMLLDIGQNVYSCNKNNGCDKNSAMMYDLCTTNEDYCDLKNYNEYIKFIMTNGQQADLAIVVKYIETLFENQ